MSRRVREAEMVRLRARAMYPNHPGLAAAVTAGWRAARRSQPSSACPYKGGGGWGYVWRQAWLRGWSMG